MPREELRKLQLERMRESLRNAYENVPLYRERFDAAGGTRSPSRRRASPPTTSRPSRTWSASRSS